MLWINLGVRPMKSFTLDSTETTHWFSVVLAWTSFSGLASIAVLLFQDPWPSFSFAFPLAGFGIGCYIGVLHALARHFSNGSTLSARLIAWSAFFSQNLLFPLYFGILVVGPWRIGLAGALVLLFAIGCLLCIYAQGISRRLIAGTGLLSFSQFCPVAQLYAVTRSLELVESLGFPAETAIGTFVATSLAGIALLVAAGIFGCVLIDPLPPAGERSATNQPT